jgi:hypothetical protein
MLGFHFIPCVEVGWVESWSGENYVFSKWFRKCVPEVVLRLCTQPVFNWEILIWKCGQSRVNNDLCWLLLWLIIILRLADLFGVSVHFFNWYSGGGGGGVQLGPVGNAATNGLLCQPRVIMMMEKSVEWLAGETEVLGVNLPQCSFVHHKPHMLPGREPGPPRWEASV